MFSYFNLIYEYLFSLIEPIKQHISAEWWNSICSFGLGALTMAIIWVWNIWQQNNFSLDDIDNLSWVEPWSVLTNRRRVLEDFTSRIGELQGEIQRRSRWPWETIRKRVSVTLPGQEILIPTDDEQQHNINEQINNVSSDYDTTTPRRSGIGSGSTTTPKSLQEQTSHISDISLMDDLLDGNTKDDETNASENPEITDTHTNKDTDSYASSSNNNKQDICIGSIFGLDVGGTLAKLVYFEQKSSATTPECDPFTISSRERHYAQAASAQAVVMARSANDMNGMDLMGTTSATEEDGHESKPGIVSNHHHSRHHRRRRSVSIGCLSRSRQLLEEQRQEQQQQQQQQQEKRQRSSIASKPIHSKASELDLRHLKDLRQESVPDDLNQYRNCVHFQAASAAAAVATEGSEGDVGRSDDDADDNDTNNRDSKINTNGHPIKPTTASGGGGGGGMKKSRSMFDLSRSKKKAQALENFYSFARRLDSYHGSDHKLSFYSRELGGEFHFIHFETRRMQNAMDLIRAHNLHSSISKMGATGGGAHKFATHWEKQLAISMVKQEELDSLVAGMQFVLSTVVGECYTFRPAKKNQLNTTGAGGDEANTSTSPTNSSLSSSSTVKTSDDEDDNHEYVTTDQVGAPMLEESSSESEEFDNSNVNQSQDQHNSHDKPQSHPKTTGSDPRIKKQQSSDEWWWSRKVQRDAISYSNSSAYPYMLVTIGTGVSILRVDGPRQHERISGSTIGGGTYWGLIRLLTDVEDFDDVMRLAEKGDPSKVDMMVGDIYGENDDALQKLGLPKHIVASSFGKLVAKPNPADGLLQEDLARALLLMVTNNIGQVAYLNAKLHKTPRIYFVGNFLRRNNISQRRLSYAIHYWSKGEMEALFLEHEGYFGALGAFILSQNINHNDAGQWSNSADAPTRGSGGAGGRNSLVDDGDDDDHDDEILINSLDKHGTTVSRRSPREKLHRRVESFRT